MEQNNVIKSLRFLAGFAWKKRPRIYFWYVMQFIALVAEKVRMILIPKFLFDEIMLLAKNAGSMSHLNNLVFYVILTLSLIVFQNLVNNIAIHIKAVDQLFISQELQLDISEKSIRMDFEYTEDPEALDRMNRAREGIDWYSGGFTGIFDQLFNVVSNIFVVAGVIAVLIFKCPVLIPVQVLAMILSALFVNKNNKIELSFFSKLAKDNRIFNYYFWNVADPQFGKDIRLYNAANMLAVKSDV